MTASAYTHKPQYTRREKAHILLAKALWGFTVWNFLAVLCLGMPVHRFMPSVLAFLALGPVMLTYPARSGQPPTSYPDYMGNNRRVSWRTPCNDPVRGAY